MGIFNKIFGSNNKIHVKFIDASNGKTIAVSDMLPKQLPETFELQTTMHLNNEDWSIVEAIPPNSRDFVRSKRLTLRMQKVTYMNPRDLLFTLPTISNELPRTAKSSLHDAFEYAILEDDWRQSEFLEKSSLPLVETEIVQIEEIRRNHSKEVDAEFEAFTKCHSRDSIGEPNLRLPFERLKEILNIENVGSLKMANSFVENGFAIKTDATSFYGIVENGIVSDFCIREVTDKSSSDIQTIIEEFNLVFVDWYHCQIISSDD